MIRRDLHRSSSIRSIWERIIVSGKLDMPFPPGEKKFLKFRWSIRKCVTASNVVNILLWCFILSISEACQDSSRGGFAELRELCPCWRWGGSQLGQLSGPGRSCAPSPSTCCRIKKAGMCSPAFCCKHIQQQLLITGSRLLIGIKLQSFMGIQWLPKVYLGVPILPCSSQDAALWVAVGMIQCTAFHFEAFSCATWHQDIPDQPPDLYFEAFSCSSWHEDVPDQPPNLYFEAFSCSSRHEDVPAQPPNLAASMGTLCEDIWLHW